MAKAPTFVVEIFIDPHFDYFQKKYDMNCRKKIAKRVIVNWSVEVKGTIRFL